MLPVALTIAGSDPCGGAGMQADLKTFHQRGVYGTAVLTLLTVQNTLRAGDVRVLEPEFVAAQLDAVLEDMTPGAAKTGALGSAAVVEAVAERARRFTFPLVVDPVLVSKHGTALLRAEARDALVRSLLPHAALVTPNLPEAAVLLGIPEPRAAAIAASKQLVDELRALARAVAQLGPRAVVVKGGHLSGDAIDVLYADGAFHEFAAPRIESKHTHGTGCTYSACIAAELAKGASLVDAVATAKRFITRAIETAPALGGGFGPVNHFACDR